MYLPRYRKNLKEEINFINSLPDVDHVEVWVEEDLSPLELKTLKSSLKNMKYSFMLPGQI